jgi:hypothetical protein
MGPYLHGASRPQVADGRDDLQIWRIAANIFKYAVAVSQKGAVFHLDIGQGGITTPHPTKPTCYELLHCVLERGPCEHGNEHGVPYKAVNFLTG